MLNPPDPAPIMVRLDPVQQARNITALGNTSRADRDPWDEFTTNAEPVAAEATWESLTHRGGTP